MYSPHTLVAWGGTLSDGEIWQNGVRVVGFEDQPLTESACVEYMEGFAPDLSDWFSDDDNNMATDAALTWLKVNNIGPDGRYVNPTDTNVYDYSSPVPGISGQSAPDFCSICFSWTTALMRGPGHTGRIYPPNYTYTALGSRFSSAGQVRAVATAKALLTVMAHPSEGPNVTPVVASRVNGVLAHITGVRVGDVYDVQRRRKNALPENYESDSFSPS